MKALSVRNPIAWYLLLGVCPLVNRAEMERYRGPLLIHVPQTINEADRIEAQQMAKRAGWTGGVPDMAEMRAMCGKIVGMVEMVDCVETHPSPFFCGRYGLVFEKPHIFREPVAYPGQLSMFDVPQEFVPAGAGGGRPAGSVALDLGGKLDFAAPTGDLPTLAADPLQRGFRF